MVPSWVEGGLDVSLHGEQRDSFYALVEFVLPCFTNAFGRVLLEYDFFFRTVLQTEHLFFLRGFSPGNVYQLDFRANPLKTLEL